MLEELGIQVELCTDNVRAAVRLAQERYDLIILDCETQAGVLALLHESRSSRLNDATLTVVVVAGQESIREMFSLGVNFVLYKPVSHERALSTLRAAQTVLHRDKRRKARAAVHTHATIDYAGEERAKATLVNLAEDGMGVNFGKKLPPTCKVYFQFQLPGQMKNVRLSGQVVWQDWNGRAGIQFVDVPQASRRVLQEWLKVNVAEAPKQETSAEAARDLPFGRMKIRLRRSSRLSGRKRRAATAKQGPDCGPSRITAAGRLDMRAAWERKFTRGEARCGTTAI